MLETDTKLNLATPAFCKAYSNDFNFSRSCPTPRVRNKYFGKKSISSSSVSFRLNSKSFFAFNLLPAVAFLGYYL